MSYTSGRTVKSRAKTQPTTVATATRDARRLVSRHLKGKQGVTVDSRATAHTVTLAPMVSTHIGYGVMELDQTRALADAATALPGYHSMAWNISGLTILRSV